VNRSLLIQAHASFKQFGDSTSVQCFRRQLSCELGRRARSYCAKSSRASLVLRHHYPDRSRSTTMQLRAGTLPRAACSSRALVRRAPCLAPVRASKTEKAETKKKQDEFFDGPDDGTTPSTAGEPQQRGAWWKCAGVLFLVQLVAKVPVACLGHDPYLYCSYQLLELHIWHAFCQCASMHHISCSSPALPAAFAPPIPLPQRHVA
jgi:hypothetical protein